MRHYVHPTRLHAFSSLTIETISRTRKFIEYLYHYKELGLPRKLNKYYLFMAVPVPPVYIPPTDPIVIARRDRQNLLRRLRNQANRENAEQSSLSMAK